MVSGGVRVELAKELEVPFMQALRRRALQLDTGELLIKDEVASLITGLVNPPIRLLLTNRRLVIIPIFPIVSSRLKAQEYPLSAINSVMPGRWWYRLIGPYVGLPTFKVRIDDHQSTIVLQVKSASKWISAIRNAIYSGMT
jgi:hypothetical protein